MRHHRPEQLRFDWVLIANAARARCFVRDADNGALREFRAFVHPASRLDGSHLVSDRPGHAFKGAASTQFEPHTDARTKEHTRFAHEIAAWLEEQALANRFEHLALFASSAFLGELRAQLGAAARGRLQASAAHDLTTCTDRELEQRVTSALTA